MTNVSKNEGEGSRSAAREYNEKAREFAENEEVDAKAQEAQAAVESDEAEELAQAEKEGKSKARSPGTSGNNDQ